MSKPNHLNNWECWWLGIGQAFGILLVKRFHDYQLVTPRLGFIGEFFMRKSGLRSAVGQQHPQDTEVSP